MIRVTAEEKQVMQQHCTEIKNILDKYPWFEPNNRYLVTSMHRCKSYVDALERELSYLECEDC